jgi:NAD(P)-dependent dehydrogenase (short-subunit alcohol dehydrogenase family)
MKILITGSPNYGIASALNNLLSANHELTFIGKRFNGSDLTYEVEMTKLAVASLNYDVFINNSRLSNYAQIRLFEKVYTTWLRNNKTNGRIINVGSTVDIASDKVLQYGAEKAALKRISEQAGQACVFRKSNIKVTYLSMGWVDTPIVNEHLPNVKKHSVDEIAEAIRFIIEYPYSNTNISEIRLEPIQS